MIYAGNRHRIGGIMKNQTPKDIAMKVSIQTLFVNIILTAFKLFAGIVANSAAMISDAIHSASDVLSTFVVMAGITISSKKADKEHPYGHERLECVAAIILAIMLFLTGVGIGYSGLQKILKGVDGSLGVPGGLALVAALSSIVIKEWMFWFTRAAAKEVNSGALMADAWHHRSDALSSVGSFIGVLGARLGFPILDPIASLLISFFILKAAYDIFADAINKMADKSCDELTVEQMRELILMQDGVQTLDLIQTRLFGSKVYVDIEIGVYKELTLETAHHIAEAVHDEIEQNFEHVKHCMVHVNPVGDNIME